MPKHENNLSVEVVTPLNVEKALLALARILAEAEGCEIENFELTKRGASE